MNSHAIYLKTEQGEEAVERLDLLVRRNLRMVLVQVDGKSTVADLESKLGNRAMVERSLRTLAENGFITLSESSVTAEDEDTAPDVTSESQAAPKAEAEATHEAEAQADAQVEDRQESSDCSPSADAMPPTRGQGDEHSDFEESNPHTIFPYLNLAHTPKGRDILPPHSVVDSVLPASATEVEIEAQQAVAAVMSGEDREENWAAGEEGYAAAAPEDGDDGQTGASEDQLTQAEKTAKTDKGKKSNKTKAERKTAARSRPLPWRAWGKRALVWCLILVLLVPPLVALLYPYQQLIPTFSKRLSRLLQTESRIGDIELQLSQHQSPYVFLALKDVRLQVGEGEKQQIVLDTVQLSAWDVLRSAASEQWTPKSHTEFSRVQAHGVTADVATWLTWLSRLNSPQSPQTNAAAPKLALNTVTFSALKLPIPGVTLPLMNGDIHFSAGPRVREIRLAFPAGAGIAPSAAQADGPLLITMTPLANQRLALQIQADRWQPRHSPSILFGVDGKGEIHADGIDLQQFDVNVLGGRLVGHLSLRWNAPVVVAAPAVPAADVVDAVDADNENSAAAAPIAPAVAAITSAPWQLHGQAELRALSMAEIVKDLRPEARVEGDLQGRSEFHAAAADWDSLGRQLRADSEVSIRHGTVYGVNVGDIARRGPGSQTQGGVTRVKLLRATTLWENQTLQVQMDELDGGLFAAHGQFQLLPSNEVQGKIAIELDSTLAKRRLLSDLSGSLPKLTLTAP